MSPTRFPRIVGLLFMVAALWGVNQVEPRIVPSILALLVLYAVLTNVDRFGGLVREGNQSLGGAFARRQ